MHTKLKICSWNCKGYRSRYLDLQIMVKEHKPDVLMLQETHLPSENQLKIPGYTTYRKDPRQGTRQGGLAILVAAGVPSQEVVINSEYTLLALRVGSTYPLTVCNIYLAQDDRVTQAECVNIVQQITTKPYLLAGDFNAHSQLWGSPNQDSRGTTIDDFIDQNNLFLLNDNQPTYIDARSGKPDSIDLAISSIPLGRLSDFAVLSDLYGSDHYPLMITVFPQNGIRYLEERWSFKKADWEAFGRLLSRIPVFQPIHDCSNYQMAEDLHNYLVDAILDAAAEAIPKIKIQGKRPRVPWWNRECRTALRDRRKALWRFKRNANEENFNNFKRARAISKRVFREAKKASWRNYISGINQSTESSEVWRRVRILSGKSNGKRTPLIETGNSTLSDPKEVAEEIGAHFAKVSATESYPTDFQSLKKEVEKTQLNFGSDNAEKYNQEFTMWELETTLKMLKNTAPGPDQVHNIMLKNLPKPFLSQLLGLFNLLWTNDLYINAWRESVIIPVAKPGKNPYLAESYRPIAMTNTLGKLMERLVNFRLVWVLESQHLVSRHQAGFRRNRSTMDHLATLETYIRDGFVQGKVTVGVFFDIEKAYDTTWRYEILKQINKHGFRGHLPKFISNFLSRRTFRVKVGDTLSSMYEQENGVPQGAVLSVTLFLLAIHEAAEVIPTCIQPLLFVDDFTLLFRAKSPSAAAKVMQQGIHKLSNWATKTGLKFSPIKTQSILFSPRKRKYQPRLDLLGQAIPTTTQVKYLGLILDERLSWKPHIDYLKAKCKKDLNLLRIIQGQNWGADRQTLLKLYNQITRTKIDYGSFIYGSAKTSLTQTLEPIQNSGLRCALGAFKTSPVESLRAEANEFSLEQRRNLLLLRYGFKIQQFTDNPTSKLFQSPKFLDLYESNDRIAKPVGFRWRKLVSNLNLSELPIPTTFTIPKTPPWTIKKPMLKMSSRQLGYDNKEHLRVLEKFKNAEHIYCDGSKTLIGAGCAVVHKTTAIRFSCTKWSSITEVELEAIRQSIKYVVEQKAEEAVIFTDSRSALQTLSNLHSQNPVVGNLRDLIASSTTRIKFCWVPSHSGITGNEAADKEAKLAIDNGQRLGTIVTWKDLDSTFRRTLKEAWQNSWTDMTNIKLRQIKPNLGLWNTSNRQNRREETRLARLRIGHTRLTHSYLFTRDQTKPKCRFCNDDTTVKHILADCVGLDQLRAKYNIPDTHIEILGDNEGTVERLFLFLTEADLIDEI